jgi:hypothetical protein
MSKRLGDLLNAIRAKSLSPRIEEIAIGMAMLDDDKRDDEALMGYFREEWPDATDDEIELAFDEPRTSPNLNPQSS